MNVSPDRVGVRQLEEEEAGVAPELGHLHPQPALTLLPLVSQEAVAVVVPVIHLGNILAIIIIILAQRIGYTSNHFQQYLICDPFVCPSGISSLQYMSWNNI